jgi:hypothetical protein
MLIGFKKKILFVSGFELVISSIARMFQSCEPLKTIKQIY